jgi:hypothetical protein
MVLTLTTGQTQNDCSHNRNQIQNTPTFLKNLKWNYHIIQQFYFWVYTQENWKQGLEEYLYTHD